jgi:hypothetical protein
MHHRLPSCQMPHDAERLRGKLAHGRIGKARGACKLYISGSQNLKHSQSNGVTASACDSQQVCVGQLTRGVLNNSHVESIYGVVAGPILLRCNACGSHLNRKTQTYVPSHIRGMALVEIIYMHAAL